MENHSDINLSQLRNYIIRYGAKCMENHESDLFYDCRALGKLCPGDSVYWMVSELHSYLYSSDEIIEEGLNVETLWGNRCNFKITCTKIEPYDAPKECNMYFDMKREWSDGNIRREVGQPR